MEMMERVAVSTKSIESEREKYQITYSVIQYWSIFIKEKRKRGKKVFPLLSFLSHPHPYPLVGRGSRDTKTLEVANCERK